MKHLLVGGLLLWTSLSFAGELESCPSRRGGFVHDSGEVRYIVSHERDCQGEVTIHLRLARGWDQNGQSIADTLDTVTLFAGENDFVFACTGEDGRQTGDVAIGLGGSARDQPFVVRAWRIDKETKTLKELFIGPAICKQIVIGCC